jgi:hypothetical protein
MEKRKGIKSGFVERKTKEKRKNLIEQREYTEKQKKANENVYLFNMMNKCQLIFSKNP